MRQTDWRGELFSSEVTYELDADIRSVYYEISVLDAGQTSMLLCADPNTIEFDTASTMMRREVMRRI